MRGHTIRGAFSGALMGLVSAVTMVVLSPAVLVKTFGFKDAIFPCDAPALFSMTIAFVGIWLISKLDTSARADRDRAAFDAPFVRSETEIGAEGASGH